MDSTVEFNEINREVLHRENSVQNDTVKWERKCEAAHWTIVVFRIKLAETNIIGVSTLTISNRMIVF